MFSCLASFIYKNVAKLRSFPQFLLLSFGYALHIIDMHIKIGQGCRIYVNMYEICLVVTKQNELSEEISILSKIFIQVSSRKTNQIKEVSDVTIFSNSAR